MTAWWRTLSERERVLVGGAAALFAVVFLWFAVIGPASAWRAGAAARAQAAESGYRLVSRAAALANSSAKDPNAPPLRNAVVQAAASLKIDLSFVNALPDGTVEVQGGTAAPERVFQLLSTLETKQAVKIIDVDIARSADNPASVRFQATLSK